MDTKKGMIITLTAGIFWVSPAPADSIFLTTSTLTLHTLHRSGCSAAVSSSASSGFSAKGKK